MSMDHKIQFHFLKRETLDRAFLKLLNWNKTFQTSISLNLSICPLASWLFGKSPTWSLKVRVCPQPGRPYKQQFSNA